MKKRQKIKKLYLTIITQTLTCLSISTSPIVFQQLPLTTFTASHLSFTLPPLSWVPPLGSSLVLFSGSWIIPFGLISVWVWADARVSHSEATNQSQQSVWRSVMGSQSTGSRPLRVTWHPLALTHPRIVPPRREGAGGDGEGGSQVKVKLGSLVSFQF